MYGIKVVNGDLLVRGDGNVVEISGADRVKQELSHWLIEPLGSDTVYRRFGSTLWDSVGEPVLSQTLNEISAEVERVVNNYIAYQKRQVNEDMLRGVDAFSRNWGADDIIDSVASIDVSAVADTVYVKVELVLSSGDRVVIRQSS